MYAGQAKVICYLCPSWRHVVGGTKCLFGVGVSLVSGTISGMKKVLDKCGLNKDYDARIN